MFMRCVLFLAIFSSSLLAGEPASPASFEKLRSLIKPRASEQLWEKIPWQTSLWAARHAAAAVGKPILLWEMDGHPLGCT